MGWFVFSLLFFKEYEGDNPDVWIVLIGPWTYSPYNSRWMNHKIIGNNCLIPSIDMTDEEHIFSSEELAVKFIAMWWKDNIE